MRDVRCGEVGPCLQHIVPRLPSLEDLDTEYKIQPGTEGSLMVSLDIPVELLVKIFLNLDLQSALSFRQVNHSLYQLYQVSPELQYHIECKIAGMYDNPKCILPIAARLQVLREREMAWASLLEHINAKKPSPYTFDVSAFDTPVENSTATMPSPDTLPGLESQPAPIFGGEGTAGCDSTQSELSTGELIASAICAEEHNLIASLIVHAISEESFDFHISLVQHSSKKPHPSAAQPIFPIFQLSDHPSTAIVEMLIVGENLVLAFEAPFKKLYFYDWKTGAHKSTCPHYGYTDFTFLRHDLLCHPNPQDLSLDIYYIPPSSEGGPVRRIQSLLLPKAIFAGGPYDWIAVNGPPNPISGGPPLKYASPHQPFFESPEESIVTFKFLGPQSLALVIHRRTLLKFVPPREHWPKEEIYLTPKDGWTSEAAIFDTTRNCTIITSGQKEQRCLLYRSSSRAASPYSILDFSSCRARRAQAVSCAPTLHEAGSLPYRVITLPEG